jgi:hypothetical protein
MIKLHAFNCSACDLTSWLDSIIRSRGSISTVLIMVIVLLRVTTSHVNPLISVLISVENIIITAPTSRNEPWTSIFDQLIRSVCVHVVRPTIFSMKFSLVKHNHPRPVYVPFLQFFTSLEKLKYIHVTEPPI